LFAFVVAFILALILGLTLGPHREDEHHSDDDANDLQPLNPQDPRCVASVVDQDIFDICHCYGNASLLALNSNETRAYVESIAILRSDKLLDTEIMRDSCSLENQAILSLASFARLGFQQNTDESIDGLLRNALADIIKQHFILKMLFLTTRGPAWRMNDGWRTNIHMCTWKGISCNFLERVQVIRLPTNMLNGTMPWQLGDMPFLRTLDLSDNPDLTGTVPPSLFLAKKLHDLELQECNLSGMLPKEIGGLPVLDRLNMARNAFIGSIPTDFGNLRRMRELNLGYNKLEGKLPDAMGNLTNLEILNVRNNLLTGKIPTSLGQLEFLEQLDLSRNLLSGSLPDEVSRLELLETIILSNTRLTGEIPDSYCDFDRTNSIAVVSCRGNFTLKIACECCSTSAVCAHSIPSAA
jgi:Leucine-rich repeat (LRR) protein